MSAEIAIAAAVALEQQCAAVLALHRDLGTYADMYGCDVSDPNHTSCGDGAGCAECGQSYPCPTARILLPDYSDEPVR